MDPLKKRGPNPKSAKVMKNLIKISVTTFDNVFWSPQSRCFGKGSIFPPNLPGGGTKGAKSEGFFRSRVFFLKNGSWDSSLLPQEMRAKEIQSSCQDSAIPCYELYCLEVRDGEQPQGHDSFKIQLIIPATLLGIKSWSWKSLGRRIFLSIWLPEHSLIDLASCRVSHFGNLFHISSRVIFRTFLQFMTDLCFLFFLQSSAWSPKPDRRCQSHE